MITEKDFKLLLREIKKQREEIQELKAMLQSHPNLSKEIYLTFEQAAKLLGVGKTKMSELLRNGELPFATKVGKQWRLSQSELERYIART